MTGGAYFWAGVLMLTLLVVLMRTPDESEEDYR